MHILKVPLKVKVMGIYFESMCKGQFSCIYKGLNFRRTFECQIVHEYALEYFDVMCGINGMSNSM